MKNDNSCIVCNNAAFFGKSKTAHLYNRNCKLKIQKSIIPNEALPINKWYNYINNEVTSKIKKNENKIV